MAKQDWSGDFETLSRQYWSGWNEMMRQAAGASAAPASPFAGMGQGFSMPGFGAPGFGAGFGQPAWPGAMPGQGGWQDALGQWSRLAQSMGAQRPPAFNDTIDATLGRFQHQAGDWYGRMQELAGQFAGQAVEASEVAERWKQMLEAGGEGAWLDMFRGMQSPNMHGFDAWYEAVQPLLAGWRSEARGWLGLPTFGLAREHQERLQKLMQAQLDYQDTLSAHNAMLSRSSQAAYANFEKKLAERELPGLEITSARALFDLWIDAAEEAFADMALSPDYRETYGAMVNAQMRLRNDVQKEVEQATGLLGMPTRTELESAHRKIAELERLVRRMARGESAARPEDAAPSATTRVTPTRRAPRTPARKAPARKVAKKAAGTPGARKVAKKAASRPAAKKTARKAVAGRAAPAKKSAAGKTVNRSR